MKSSEFEQLPADIKRELMHLLLETAVPRIINAKKNLVIQEEAGKGMKDVNEVFDGVQNAEFKALQLVEGVTDEVSVFTLNEPSIEVWNKRAALQNTKMFYEINNRMPEDYQEVLSWIHSGSVNEKSHSVCATVASA